MLVPLEWLHRIAPFIGDSHAAVAAPGTVTS
jgi:hypothetical protein